MSAQISRRSRARFAAIAASALLSLLALPAGPAQADDRCADGYVCFWQEAHFNGQKYVVVPNDPALACRVLPFAALSALVEEFGSERTVMMRLCTRFLVGAIASSSLLVSTVPAQADVCGSDRQDYFGNFAGTQVAGVFTGQLTAAFAFPNTVQTAVNVATPVEGTYQTGPDNTVRWDAEATLYQGAATCLGDIVISITGTVDNPGTANDGTFILTRVT